MIFTLFMCCFLGLGAMQPQVAAPRSYENNITEYKHKQNYSIGGQYSASRYFGMTDIASYTFFKNCTFFLGQQTEYSVNGGSDWWLTTPLDTGITLSFDIDLGTSVSVSYLINGNNTGYVDIGHLEKISVTKTCDNTGQYYPVGIYNFDFYIRNTNNDLVKAFIFSLRSPCAQYEHVGFIPSFSFHSPVHDWNFAYLRFYEYYNAYSDPDAKHFLSQMIIIEESEEYRTQYSLGYDSGYYDGTKANNEQAYAQGFAEGQNRPNADTYNRIYASGRQSGYAEGLAEAQDQTTLASQIFTGFVEVGLLPVNVFLQMFEYEVFGINIAGFVSALITIAMVIIIIRVVTGKKDG